MTQNLSERVSVELLPYVNQPGQYIGREFNQPVADGDWEKADVRIALAFPDAYAIGMSHLGSAILYWQCNQTPGVCAERCYTPWVDAIDVMRQKRIPLFTWDTRRPVSSADILAISLQYELGFTNVLLMLDLAGIPRRAAQRDDSHPLVIVGGPQADNPEPVAEFVDLVVIGDGEDSTAGIIEAYREMKANGVRRRDMIEHMARRFPWIYAPNLYEATYHADGTLSGLPPRAEGLPAEICRCGTPDFEHACVPPRPLVPHVETVHDRIAIEIMRGCPQHCRFCHASHTKRPMRIRSVDRILEIAEEQYRATGCDEVGLLSLSTADYPKLESLATQINERFAQRHVNISLPSLRVDKMLKSIPWMASSVRKSGLTIAAEAARDRMRDAIRKKVTDGNLLDGVMEAYKAGWRRIKCYFMVGFPGETEDDIRGIHELAVELSEARRKVKGAPANINASVSWLVPKPHTPLQWAAQQRQPYFEEARRLLKDIAQASRKRSVRIQTHDTRRSILEAVLSQGDRRLGVAIERAYELGARFDAWDEHFHYELWLQAFEETGIDPNWYAHREKPFSEILPWDHIRSGPSRERLERGYRDVFDRLGQPMPEPGILP